MKFIDLFAGTGGIRIPFEKFFGSCVFSSECDKFAQKTYEVNFDEKPFGDIKKINEENIPDFDILLAGFPCQPFSKAGLKNGFKDSRGTLFFDIARILKEHEPEIVFLENVSGLKSHDGGKTFKVIKNTLEELGYTVYHKVFNAKDFGIPQHRKRIYLVCFKDSDINFEFPTPPKTPTKVKDILEEDVDDKYTISDKLWKGHKRRKRENEEKGYGFGYNLVSPESEYTRAITARYYKDGSEILIEQEGKNPRKLTPREGARLQGFPDSFKIPVSDTQAYKQFGNAVPLPVVEAIAKSIKKAVEENENK